MKKTPKQTNYKHPAPYYAKIYEVSSRTVQRWMENGYAIDQPEILAKQVTGQKNRPESYRRKKFSLTNPAPGVGGKRGVDPRILNVLTAGQRMRRDVKRMMRKFIGGMESGVMTGQVAQIIFDHIEARLMHGVSSMAGAAAGADPKTLEAQERDIFYPAREGK